MVPFSDIFLSLPLLPGLDWGWGFALLGEERDLEEDVKFTERLDLLEVFPGTGTVVPSFSLFFVDEMRREASSNSLLTGIGLPGE